MSGDTTTNIDTEGGGVFQGTFQSTHHGSPTLSSVAKKIADQEGKILDKKQYIAYKIIACSFLLRLINDDGWRARECKQFCIFKGRASVFSPPNDTPWHAFDNVS